MEMVQDTFRSFADNVVAPHAEHVHRTNGDVPEDVIAGLAEIGAFGLRVPAEYGGYSEGGDGEYLAMVVATEELSRASLGIGGSLITRPEILTRALVKGGTEEQKLHWLPKLATAEVMAAVAVTEPDYGSDVAGIKVTATPADGPDGDAGLRHQRRQDVVHVRRPRRRADAARPHRPRPRQDPPRPEPVHRAQAARRRPRLRVHAGATARPARIGKMEGRPIDTIGYRGMHSYEIALEDWWVPADHLIGEADGLGRGFYYQMEGFENGRLQTAARAVGVMQAAYEAALDYARNRKRVRLDDRRLPAHPGQARADGRADPGRPPVRLPRRHADGQGQGAMEASMVKAYVCKAAEWVTREAMQIHGGFGYAEEYAVSRLFVDARVLSIFEGADETLCLKVIARRLTAAELTHEVGQRRDPFEVGAGWSSYGSRRIGCRPAAVAPPTSIVTESPT